MGPFHIPWSTFGAVFCLVVAVLLALGWAARDRAREARSDSRDGSGASGERRP